MDTRGISYAPLRVEMASGLVRQYNFVPSRRFREDDGKASKLSTGGSARIDTLGAPAVTKQTKSGDSMLIQVEPVVPIP